MVDFRLIAACEKSFIEMGDVKMFEIGIIGAGATGLAHSNAIATNDECKLVAVCDIVEEKARELANPYNADCFTDYKAMCDKVHMDAVIINLPHFLHCEVSVYCMKKGINVLVEKPMAITTAECDEMERVARENNVKLAVGHVQRYFSAYSEIKKVIENGMLGKLCMITETRNVDYVSNRANWFLKKALSGGGIVMNYGAHSMDKLFYTTGFDVKNIHAVLSNPLTDDDVEINAQIFAELTNNVTAVISYCGCHVPTEDVTSFYFTDGVAKVYDGYKLQILTKDGVNNIESTGGIFVKQMIEFVKYLKGEQSEIVTYEYGRKVIEVLERIL